MEKQCRTKGNWVEPLQVENGYYKDCLGNLERQHLSYEDIKMKKVHSILTLSSLNLCGDIFFINIILNKCLFSKKKSFSGNLVNFT